MNPAWSCLTSAEFIQSPTFFLIKPFGANQLVVPGRATSVGPAHGQGSLQLAPPECPFPPGLPLPCCLAGLSQEGAASPTPVFCSRLSAILSAIHRRYFLSWVLQGLPTHNTPSWFPPFTPC
uniref:Uncharacterized protein n=1 Tax=Molossus molossus TaxID=27622 RepID=A0A7J8ERF0_MOLMO|nr:hypothetical protein HJG59_008744 [Molossus molossus]